MMKYELQRPVSCLFICVGILLGVQSVQAQESSVFYGVSLEQMEMRFGDEGEGYLRFSCANSDDAITDALSRIKTFLDNA